MAYAKSEQTAKRVSDACEALARQKEAFSSYDVARMAGTRQSTTLRYLRRLCEKHVLRLTSEKEYVFEAVRT